VAGIDRNFSPLAAFEIKFEFNLVGGPWAALPTLRCGRSAAGRTQAGARK
jgi:hypothetical protein